MSAPTAADPRFAEIESHRPYLVRYALSQLRDAQQAEEAVQEALLAALEGVSRFNGQSSLRTWLTSILRFKVIDLQRRAILDRQRHESATDLSGEGLEESWLDDLFDETGHWREMPSAWSNPDAALEQRQFFEALEKCLDRLPKTGSRVFFKREVLGEDTPAICRSEGITESNCWVVLHRARIALRSCLEKTWFASEPPPHAG